MQRGSFQRSANWRLDNYEYRTRCNKRLKHDELNTNLKINQSNYMKNDEPIECCTKRNGNDRKCRKPERNNIGLARGSEENYGDNSSQSYQANAQSSNYVDKSSNKDTYSRNEAHDNNKFRRNVRDDSVSGNTSDMLDRDGNPDEGEKENSEVSNGRENDLSIGESDQSANDGQLLVIILYYDDSDDYVIVFVFQ